MQHTWRLTDATCERYQDESNSKEGNKESILKRKYLYIVQNHHAPRRKR